MSTGPSILHVARVNPALPRGLWILALYWAVIATGGGFVAQRALATVGNTPRGVAIALVAGAILLITALYSIRVRRMVRELVLQRRRHNAILKLAAVEAGGVSGADAEERANNPAEVAKLYEAILAAEAGTVPGPKRLEQLERMYGVSLPRVWVVGPRALASGGAGKSPREPALGKAITEIERCMSEPGGKMVAVVMVAVWGLTAGLMVLFAKQVPLRGSGNLVRVGFWVVAAVGFGAPVAWATVFGKYWSMQLHERGVTLVRRGWPRARVLETVEVELGRDVLVVTVGSGAGVAASGGSIGRAGEHGPVRMGVHLAERNLRVWGGPVELPEGVVWRVLAGEQMVKL